MLIRKEDLEELASEGKRLYFAYYIFIAEKQMDPHVDLGNFRCFQQFLET